MQQILQHKQHVTDIFITTNSSPLEIPLLLLMVENGQVKQNSLHSTNKKLTSNVNVKTHKFKDNGLKTIVHANTNQRKAGTRLLFLEVYLVPITPS